MLSYMFLLTSLSFAEMKEYKFSEQESQLLVKVFKDQDGYGAFLAHNHVVLAKEWTGSLKLDEEGGEGCSLSFSLPVAKLDVDPSALRKTMGAGFEGELSDSDRATIKENMLAPDQLNSAKYSTIVFKSKSCKIDGASSKLEGDFTLRGVSKKISVPTSISQKEDSIALKGSFSIKSTDYGFQPYTAMFGQIANKSEMTVEFNLNSSTR